MPSVAIATSDIDAEIERLVALGASLVDGPAVRHTANGIEWVVLTDPDGNSFCVGTEP